MIWEFKRIVMRSLGLCRSTTLALFLFLTLAITIGFAQGLENFDNSNATASYKTDSFVGNDEITWNYVASRDENGDANGSGINGKALMLRRLSDSSKVYAENIPNGIQDFSVKLYKGFTSSGSRKVELFINGNSYGQSEGFDDFDEHIFEVSNIDVDGNFDLEIRNVTSRQIIVDDIYWTSYDSGGNPPVISDIIQTPSANNVTSSDSVSVSATVTASSGIQIVQLHWGLVSGVLTNQIEMIQDVDNVYISQDDIPSRIPNTTVYYKIVATDNNDATTSSSEHSYTVLDPQWLTLPFFNGFRDEDELTFAVDAGFEFNDVNLELSGEGYLKMGIGSSITTPPIDFSIHNGLLTYFDAATWGGIRGQKITVFVSDNNGDTYTALNSYSIDIPNAAYGTYAQYIDLSNFTGSLGRIKYEMTNGTASVRFRDLLIEEFQGYLFDAEWFPRNPNGTSTEYDDVFLLEGVANFTENIDINRLFIERDAMLLVGKNLNVHGQKILIDGDLVFTSNEASDGQLTQVNPETQIRGEATVERYLSSNRAYRMVSSPVNTLTNIRDNWQEGVNNTSIDPQYNQNPNPGFGTHITGSITGTHGFDATETGSPSMFDFDALTQEFVPIENTDENTLKSGKPYLLFVRGDRGIDLTNEEDEGETVLRSKGQLVVGDQIQYFPTMNAGEFALFGNPYQCVVDVYQLFIYDGFRINSTYYYVYDPSLGDYGAYVTVHLPTGTNVQTSAANQYLQPGQAAKFVTVENGGPQLTFREQYKAPENHYPINKGAGRMATDNMITLQLFTTENYNNNGPLHDGFGIVFDPYFNNDITAADALKPRNFYENFGIDNGGVYLSLEQREMPVTGDVFSIYSDGYQHTHYTVKMILDGFEDAIIYFDDHFTQSSTLLESGEVIYQFDVDPNNPLSVASDRFSIRVAHRLDVKNPSLEEVALFPNPLSGKRFNILIPDINETIEVGIRDMLGRKIFEQEYGATGRTLEVTLENRLDSGVYFVTVTHAAKRKTLRLIGQ